MESRPRLFAEIFSGFAALTLALVGGPGTRPPVSYMGGKFRWAPRLLGLLGLHPGQGADALLLADAGPCGWAWQALLDPATCREVAATLRGWKGEDPRALWTRLAAEPPPVGLVERTAVFLRLQAENYIGDAVHEDGERWHRCGYRAPNAARRATGTTTCLRVESQSSRLDALASIRWPESIAVHHGSAEGIDPAGVARWLWLQARTCNSLSTWWEEGVLVTADKATGRVQRAGQTHTKQSCQRRNGDDSATGMQSPATAAARAEVLHRLAWPPTAILHGRAEGLEPVGDLRGAVVYLDPPYRGRTAYAADCPRDRVLDLARRWSTAGATVLISEAEPLTELGGWDVACLNPGAQARNQEWVTCSRRLDRGALLGPLFARGAA